MRRGLKSSAAHALHILRFSIRRFPDEEGTEISRRRQRRAGRVSIRRFPDEEGTEMSRASARLCRRPPIRRFPDEEGTEIRTEGSRDERCGRRSEDSPMRRGLKYRGRREPRPTVPPIRRFPDEEGTEIRRDGAAQLAQVLAIRRFPDEEGTEMRILVGRVRHVHRRSEDSPMRRGLKCLEAATARGQNAENDQKIPR